ncbi:SDR family oxidoreductase [Actinocrispum sp. NPDC049592]|uniref:SDR family oxidoreductase n=1 Tax=Actinocrispum sp. NPDC049592 TaxID=3154835 RepID=UPI00343F15AF
MSIVITGATGHLGRLTISSLQAAGVPAAEIVAAVRSPEKAADLAAQGIRLLVTDYDEPSTWEFQPGDRVLLISSNAVGSRVAQHSAVIDAAATAGVAQLVYTSIFGADTADFRLAEEHQATEKKIIESGLPHTFLRNNWYTELFTGMTGLFLEHGAIVNNVTADARIAFAPRSDYAAAAAAVLTQDGHLNKAYELGGDVAWSYPELAAELAQQAGTAVVHKTVTDAEQQDLLVAAGLPAGYAEILVDANAGISRGALNGTPGELARLLGRPTEPMAESIAKALAG